MTGVALSIRQPWATLVVFGIKRIEIRRWSTQRTGPVLIHAGRLPDKRREAWDLLPERYREFAALRGGLVGAVTLIGCRTYRNTRQFRRDTRWHCNRPEWFQPPVMYGFEFADAAPIAFRPVKGQLYFFPVQ
jgi:hypothetical protein